MTGLVAALLKDSYGFVSIALLVYLARGVRGTRQTLDLRDHDPEPEPIST